MRTGGTKRAMREPNDASCRPQGRARARLERDPEPVLELRSSSAKTRSHTIRIRGEALETFKQSQIFRGLMERSLEGERCVFRRCVFGRSPVTRLSSGV